MQTGNIEESLAAAEIAVQAGSGVKGTGFWKSVSVVKTQPQLIDRYGDRIAAIDRSAHTNWALLTIPAWLGTLSAITATVVGVGLMVRSATAHGMFAVAVFLVGMGAVLVATHGLAHMAVGAAFGMRFTSWFVGTMKRPQPGVKVDYSTYLRTPPRRRAWMHASGAIASKLVPFAAIPFAVGAHLNSWLVWFLVALGVGQIVTDVIWSTKASDWKKFRREMAFAQDS